jgi:hypothetical protein
VLPEWGGVAQSSVTNADVRAWVARPHVDGSSASCVRKAVFALRRIMAPAGSAGWRTTPPEDVPLPAEGRGATLPHRQ